MRRLRIALFVFLADSQDLPEVWKSSARRRYQELSARQQPGERVSLPLLERGMVLAVCMEPMFESLLVQDERAIKRALRISGRTTPPGWPRHGWGDPHERYPDTRILVPVITAINRLQPKPGYVKHVRGDMRTNKDGWGEYLLRQLFADPRARGLLRQHPLIIRLVELLSRS